MLDLFLAILEESSIEYIFVYIDKKKKILHDHVEPKYIFVQTDKNMFLNDQTISQCKRC